MVKFYSSLFQVYLDENLYLSLQIIPGLIYFVTVLPLISKNLAALLVETKLLINLNPSFGDFS